MRSFGHSYELSLICKAARRLIQMGFLNIHFAFAGDGEQFKTLVKSVQSLPNVSLLGWLDRFEIFDLLNLSHVGLVPCLSVVDAMPNNPFKYLSAGLPILSSLQGEMETIIGDHNIGFSYKSSDIDTFLKFILKLSCDEKLRLHQSQDAASLFRNKFSSKIVYEAYANHVESVASQKGER